MKLYREVIIESAEQAEALPSHTIAYNDESFDSTFGERERVEYREAATRYTRGGRFPADGWQVQTVHEVEIMPHSDVVGWTALVPVEAEEQRVGDYRLCAPEPRVLTRLITPWEPS